MRICVSVVIPIYNMENYLGECLESVLSQTLHEIEVLCINDGSTDGTRRILEDFSDRDKRIVVLEQENRGVAETRNRGIREASGEYVIFMDPDDWYPETDILESLYQKAKGADALICGGEFSDYNEATGEVHTEFPKQYYGYTFEKEGMILYRDYQFDFGYHRFLFKRQFLIAEEIWFPPLIRFQDPPFMVKAMVTAGQFYAVRKIVYRYRYGHSGNIWTRQKVAEMLDGIYMDLKMALQHQLYRLLEITWYRMTREYGDPIFRELVGQTDGEIFHKVKKIYDKLPDLYREKLEFPFWVRMQCSFLEQKEEIERLQDEIIRIEHTKTFRIGKAIMYVPSKCYWGIRRKMQKSDKGGE